ncbi:conserved hypothetical protein [Trichinella spiralis]|uniref:hypothetical protein n=1 Tax=Trichinella spiralis TaxID=6334 RepID=UPI0001EFC7C6|nr:conserved hypothetical protein [Trichinella spiralis]
MICWISCIKVKQLQTDSQKSIETQTKACNNCNCHHKFHKRFTAVISISQRSNRDPVSIWLKRNLIVNFTPLCKFLIITLQTEDNFGKAAVDRFQSERTDAFQKVRLKSLKNLLLNRPRFMRAVIELRAQMDR